MKAVERDIVLFSILNWGLGHAARSIPLIKALQNQDLEVVVCSDGYVVDFLKLELDNVEYAELPAYNINYGKSSMAWNMISQLPKIFKAFRAEHRVFQKLVKKYNPAFCISDNRYGCRSTKVSSYFLGHQWNILTKNGRVHRLASIVNQYFIRKFDGLLIPDEPALSLSGKLTQNINFVHQFTGLLSRFGVESKSDSQSEYKSCTILSGPEPARTKLEVSMVEELSKTDGKHMIVRGSFSKKEDQRKSNIEFIDVANHEKLHELVSTSEIVICRSGYSSLMDYVVMGVKKMILIPTTGQTEQIYLAKRMQQLYGVQSLAEDNLGQLAALIESVENITEVKLSDHLLDQVIANLKNRISLPHVSE